MGLGNGEVLHRRGWITAEIAEMGGDGLAVLGGMLSLGKQRRPQVIFNLSRVAACPRCPRLTVCLIYSLSVFILAL
jgi:hypothetical protein